MRVAMNNIMPNIRELPISLKLNRNENYLPPIKNNGYIIDPKKFQNEIKNVDINLQEIKALLLMMLKGNSDFIKQLIKTNSNNFVNTLA